MPNTTNLGDVEICSEHEPLSSLLIPISNDDGHVSYAAGSSIGREDRTITVERPEGAWVVAIAQVKVNSLIVAFEEYAKVAHEICALSLVEGTKIQGHGMACNGGTEEGEDDKDTSQKAKGCHIE